MPVRFNGREETISKEVLFLERDRMLKEARRQIEIEKADAEQLRQMAQDDIAAYASCLGTGKDNTAATSL